ncbi:MAG: hypothetical protein OXF49_01685 [Candidatus Saccharibacteria bacterium]|nr:hypothetical protein [Candidatus Saccharibacteria bacterium]
MDSQSNQQPQVSQAIVQNPQDKKILEQKAKISSHSTQNTLQIAEIKDGIVILKDGSFRAVIEAEAINFDLMSQSEQESVEYAYQNFLNSLSFPIQINIQSRPVDVENYIKTLENSLQKQNNMLLQVITSDYLDFIANLVDNTHVMEKKFYIVLPFFNSEFSPETFTTTGKNFLNKFTAIFSNKSAPLIVDERNLKKAKTELNYRINSISSGLGLCGIRNRPLKTKELIVLYHDFYNPLQNLVEPLPEVEDMLEPVVQQQTQKAAPANITDFQKTWNQAEDLAKVTQSSEDLSQSQKEPNNV